MKRRRHPNPISRMVNCQQSLRAQKRYLRSRGKTREANDLWAFDTVWLGWMLDSGVFLSDPPPTANMTTNHQHTGDR